MPTVNMANIGPPIIPKILMAIWTREDGITTDRNASPMITMPRVIAENGRYKDIQAWFQSKGEWYPSQNLDNYGDLSLHLLS
jgi:hypothetical protein